MRNISALQAAIAMIQTPALVRTARRSALPPGMTFLLEVAADESQAIECAKGITGQSRENLRSACGFFIEQILLTNNDNSYRVLAGTSDAPPSKLRRHMALLLKWLHPDVAANAAMNSDVDRTMFANRVTEAWENLKTEERREAYAQTFARKNRMTGLHKTPLQRVNPVRNSINKSSQQAKRSRPKRAQQKLNSKSARKSTRKFKRLTIRPLGNDSLFSRLVARLKGLE